jgi:hypothetical protein
MAFHKIAEAQQELLQANNARMAIMETSATLHRNHISNRIRYGCRHHNSYLSVQQEQRLYAHRNAASAQR